MDNLTDLEKVVLQVIIDFDEGIESVTEDILYVLKKEHNINSKSARGVFSSLVKKNLIKMDIINEDRSTILYIGGDN